MDTVRQWALTVAVSAAAGGIVYMLSPKGSLGRSVRTAVSLFMLIAMLSPFVGQIDFSSFPALPSEQTETADLTDAVTDEMKTAVEAEIRQILRQNGIKAETVSINISIDGDNTMTVDKIEITADGASENIRNAEKMIKSEIGADVKIEVRE